jgi:predicted GNAT superfamily acetyltransferase
VTSGPWELAQDAAAAAGVELRSLPELADTDRVNDVIRATWGSVSAVPRELQRALQASGNAPLGAFEGDALVGVCLGFLGPGEAGAGGGREGEGMHLHSHMLAVLPGRRSSGVGYALKLGQRAAALAAGIEVARWTFDPLQARNAYFNLVKLGAAADRFHRHLYGDMGDDLNRGERTDRLEARWDLRREPGPRPVPASPAVVLGGERRPGPLGVPDGEGLVRVPSDYPALRREDPEAAAAWRDAVAEAVEACLAAGLEATGFLRDGAYVFTRRSA